MNEHKAISSSLFIDQCNNEDKIEYSNFSYIHTLIHGRDIRYNSPKVTWKARSFFSIWHFGSVLIQIQESSLSAEQTLELYNSCNYTKASDVPTLFFHAWFYVIWGEPGLVIACMGIYPHLQNVAFIIQSWSQNSTVLTGPLTWPCKNKWELRYLLLNFILAWVPGAIHVEYLTL